MQQATGVSPVLLMTQQASYGTNESVAANQDVIKHLLIVASYDVKASMVSKLGTVHACMLG